MIYASDIPQLPPNVFLREDGLFDQAFSQSYPVNDTGRVLIRLIDNKHSISDIARLAAPTLDAPFEIVQSDAVRFFAGLNRAFLVNIRKTSVLHRLFQWLWLILSNRRLLMNLGWQQMERRDIPGGASLFSVTGLIVVETALALGWWLLPVTALLFLQGWRGSPVLAVIFLGSVILHEFGHISALWATGNWNQAAFIGRHLLTVGVYRRKLRPGHELLVAVSGPLLPALVGVGILGVGRYLWDVEVQLIGTLLMTHLLTLVPLAQDGRNAIQAIRSMLGGEQS